MGGGGGGRGPGSNFTGVVKKSSVHQFKAPLIFSGKGAGGIFEVPFNNRTTPLSLLIFLDTLIVFFFFR